jgi:phosphate transport system ATP-binding protein
MTSNPADNPADGARSLLPTGPLVGLTARNISGWFGEHKVLERVSLAMDPAPLPR